MTPARMLVSVLALMSSGACDPVHGDAVAALGPEAPGVGPGPTHRPGQPCLFCHEGGLGSPPRFSIAGTLFEKPSDRIGVPGATVSVLDANRAQINLLTNSAGNFYVHASDYEPAYPVQVTVQARGGPVVHMQTLIEGNGTLAPNGGCASCHFDPPGRNSPGHVYLTLDDGGSPP